VKTWAVILLAILALSGCAVGDDDGAGEGLTEVDAAVPDTPNNPFPDATSYDARPDGPQYMAPDAALPGFPDAATSGLPGACATSSECDTGECCFALFGVCVPGQEVPVFGCIPE